MQVVIEYLIYQFYVVFGLYNAPYINSTVGFVHIFVLLLLLLLLWT